MALACESEGIGRMLVQLLEVGAGEPEPVPEEVGDAQPVRGVRAQDHDRPRCQGYGRQSQRGQVVRRGNAPTATRSTAKPRNWCHTPEESPHLREIFRLYTEARLGTRASADELNRRGVPSRAGAPWSEYSVSRVIANPVYAGDIAYGDVYAENATSRLSTGRPGGKPAPSRPPAPMTTASAPSARAITTSLG